MSQIEREDVTNKGNPFLSTKYTVSYLLLFSTSCEESKHQYLHEMGWAEDEHGLHTQNWVQAAMNTFHSKQAKWEHQLCSTCHELWPTQVCARERIVVSNVHVVNEIRKILNCIQQTMICTQDQFHLACRILHRSKKCLLLVRAP